MPYQTIDLEGEALPASFSRQGEPCFLCLVRERLVPSKPEEVVRQRMISYLERVVGVPHQLIEVEVPLCRFSPGKRKRADIIVYRDADRRHPLLLIECKRPTEWLTSRVSDQAEGYNECIAARYVALTNGHELELKDACTRKVLSGFPPFRKLLQATGMKYMSVREKPWLRTPQEALFSKRTVQKFKTGLPTNHGTALINANTIPDRCPAIIRLLDLLQDESGRLACQEIYGLSFVHDGGVRYSRYGNASGGDLYGHYRYFIIENGLADHQVVSLAIYEQQGYKKTYLMVGIDANVDIDGNKKSHHALELRLDDFLDQHDNHFKLWHDGSLTVGNRGRRSKREVLEFIEENEPDLVQGDRVMLGNLPFPDHLTWEMPEVRDFLGRITTYARLRDDYRQEQLHNTK